MFRFYSEDVGDVGVSIAASHDNGVLKLAVARCSRKDKFIRKKGRFIAEGRLAKDKYYLKKDMATCKISDFLDIAKKVVKEVINSPKVFASEVILRMEADKASRSSNGKVVSMVQLDAD